MKPTVIALAALAALAGITGTASATTNTSFPAQAETRLFAMLDAAIIPSGDFATLAWVAPEAKAVSLDCAGATSITKRNLPDIGTETITAPRLAPMERGRITCEITATLTDGTVAVERVQLLIENPVPDCKGQIHRGPETADGSYSIRVQVPDAFIARCESPRPQDWSKAPFAWPAHNDIEAANAQPGAWLPRVAQGLVDGSMDGVVTDTKTALPLITPADDGRTYARCYILDSGSKHVCKIEKYGI